MAFLGVGGLLNPLGCRIGRGCWKIILTSSNLMDDTSFTIVGDGLSLEFWKDRGWGSLTSTSFLSVSCAVCDSKGVRW